MARRRQEPQGRSLRLPAAAGLLAISALMLFLVLDGRVFDLTQGATIGLYLTIVMLLTGFLCAAGACVLAVQVVLRPRRRMDNIIEVSPKSRRRDAA